MTQGGYELRFFLSHEVWENAFLVRILEAPFCF